MLHAFQTFQLDTCEKCRKSSIFIVKFSTGMSKNLFDTCVFWSCVTRCGCRTTSSTLFTVHAFLPSSYLTLLKYSSPSPVIPSTWKHRLYIAQYVTRPCAGFRHSDRKIFPPLRYVKYQHGRGTKCSVTNSGLFSFPELQFSRWELHFDLLLLQYNCYCYMKSLKTKRGVRKVLWKLMGLRGLRNTL